jgi:pyruvate dehydrogenase E1 component alpha subunit
MSIDLCRLYSEMRRIRLVEEAIVQLYPDQEMRCPVHLCIGQEAVAVGVCATLEGSDYVFSGHRSHGHYLAKGGSLRAMLAELYGRETGCVRGRGGSMHLFDRPAGFLAATPIVGSVIPIAVGTAFGSRLRGEPHVTVVFFGDAATEEGVFHEAVDFAVLRKLPVVFVCENNLYSVYSPLSVRQPGGRRLTDLAAGHGIASRHGDGNDVLEVVELTRQAVARARAGGGPTFLEFETYRWREHCGPNYDNDLGYRTEAEFREWQERDPIPALERQLREQGMLTDQDISRIEDDIETEIVEAVAFARGSAFPEAGCLTEEVYA